MDEPSSSTTLPTTINFEIEIKQSVRKSLCKFDFQMAKQDLSWEFFINEILRLLEEKNANMDKPLNFESLAGIVRYFSSSRTKIDKATLLTQENFKGSLEHSYKNYNSFSRVGETLPSGFRLRLIVLMSDIGRDLSALQAQETQSESSSLRKRAGIPTKKSAARMNWCNPTASTIGAQALAHTFRINGILDVNFGQKRQECVVELSVPEVVEIYRAVERQYHAIQSQQNGEVLHHQSMDENFGIAGDSSNVMEQ